MAKAKAKKRAAKKPARPARRTAPPARRPSAAPRPAKRAAPTKRATPSPTNGRAAPNPINGADPLRAVEQFLYRQAALLDDRHWEGFIELFAGDGIYWMPASPDQTTGDGVPAIFYEDRDLMRVRMKRVTHPHAWSQAPDWGTNHVVSNVMIESADAKTGNLVVRSRFHMMEFRRDATRHFAGSYRHHLARTSDGYRIKLQRVDMVNGEGTYDYVLQIWV
jgi:3-phenylpropionate/cinnamic acid dioxygenase small subunit